MSTIIIIAWDEEEPAQIYPDTYPENTETYVETYQGPVL